MPEKGKSKERREIEEFERKVNAGEITSYTQFPPKSWGFGMLIDLAYLEEIAIFKEITGYIESQKEGYKSKDFAKLYLAKSKELYTAGRNKEAFVYAYWVGKMLGISEKIKVKAILMEENSL